MQADLSLLWTHMLTCTFCWPPTQTCLCTEFTQKRLLLHARLSPHAWAHAVELTNSGLSRHAETLTIHFGSHHKLELSPHAWALAVDLTNPGLFRHTETLSTHFGSYHKLELSPHAWALAVDLTNSGLLRHS